MENIMNRILKQDAERLYPDRTIFEVYKDFLIVETERYYDYGAWIGRDDYVFFFYDDDAEKWSFAYGSSNTIQDCKDQIDSIIDLHEDEFLNWYNSTKEFQK